MILMTSLSPSVGALDHYLLASGTTELSLSIEVRCSVELVLCHFLRLQCSSFTAIGKLIDFGLLELLLLYLFPGRGVLVQRKDDSLVFLFPRVPQIDLQCW